MLELKSNINASINNAINFANNIEDLLEYNKVLVTNEKGLGFVYFIYLFNKNDNIVNLVYIGRSKGHLFKTRMKNHFYKKHPKTGSKLSLIQSELNKDNKVKFKYIKVSPESFRNILEEELINHFLPEWNIQKRKK